MRCISFCQCQLAFTAVQGDRAVGDSHVHTDGCDHWLWKAHTWKTWSSWVTGCSRAAAPLGQPPLHTPPPDCSMVDCASDACRSVAWHQLADCHSHRLEQRFILMQCHCKSRIKRLSQLQILAGLLFLK